MTSDKNDTNLRFLLIGCGRISQVHLTALSNEPRAELVGVADIDLKAAKGAAEAYGGKAFDDPVKALEELKPDAVILCTPPNTHREICEIALAAGAHVLCEKPLALTPEDAQAMITAADKHGKVLMMASKFRYTADIVKAKGVIQSGILGEIVLFENEFCARVDMKGRWNSRRDIAGGGVVIDNGSHSVDIVRYLVGPIADIQALLLKQWQDFDVEDSARLFARCEDGTMASIDLSWSIHKESPYYIHVYGTEGTLEVGWGGGRYRQSEKMDWIQFGDGYDKFQAVGAQLANFIRTVRGEDKPVITPEDALESVRVIQSAYRNAHESHWDRVTA